MISVITTTASTIGIASVAGLVPLLGIAGVITLLATLFMKELAINGEHSRLRLFGRTLDVVILPLFFVFSFIVATKVWEILS